MRWLVVRQRETEPVEVYPFDEFADALAFYDKAALAWSDVYLTAAVITPGPPPDWSDPINGSPEERAVVGSIDLVRQLADTYQKLSEQVGAQRCTSST